MIRAHGAATTEWHCTTTADALACALRKVVLARHPDASSPLSGTRLHVLGNSLHLTATDEAARAAIYHLPVLGAKNVKFVAPARLLPAVVRTFADDQRLWIGTDPAQVLVAGEGGGTVTLPRSSPAPFTVGCYAGNDTGWRTVEARRYWLRGPVDPVPDSS